MGPAYGRDPRDARRRSRCGSLATLPRVAFRPPPLTPASPPNGCARWLPEVAIAPPWSPGWASRVGSPSAVVRRSPGSRLLGVGSTGAHLPGLALPWATGSLRAGKIWIPLHGIILPVCGGTANRSEVALAEGLKERAGTPVTSRPQALSRRARSDSPVPFAQAPRTPASPSLSRAA